MRRFTNPRAQILGAAAGALLAVVGTAHAQTVVPVLLQGDPVLGSSGVLSDVQEVAVNDNGDWIARVRATVGSATVEMAVVDGGAVLIEDDPLVYPPGTTLDGVDKVDLNGAGQLIWVLDTSATSTMDVVLYWNFSPLAQEGMPATGSGFPSGSIWKAFYGVDVGTNDTLLVVGAIDAPSVNGINDGALVRLTYDDTGAVTDQELLLLKDDFVPGTLDRISTIGTNNGGDDVAEGANGSWIAFARANSGVSNDELVFLDGALIAREASPGPVANSTWKTLGSNALGMNDVGDYAFRGTYTIDDGDPIHVLIKNGAPYLTEGDTSASIAPYAFSNFGNAAAIRMRNDGGLFFMGATTNPDTSRGEGYFRNDRFIVQQGVSKAGSGLISTMLDTPNTFAVSPSGRYVVFEAVLSDGRDGVFLVDLGQVTKMQSCSTAPATLDHVSGLPLLGETLGLDMDGGQDVGVTPILLVSSAPIAGWPPCGLTTPFGELLIDVSPGSGNPVLSMTAGQYSGSPSAFSLQVPNDTALLGIPFYAQGVFVDFGDQSPAENFRLTNGLAIELALP